MPKTFSYLQDAAWWRVWTIPLEASYPFDAILETDDMFFVITNILLSFIFYTLWYCTISNSLYMLLKKSFLNEIFLIWNRKLQYLGERGCYWVRIFRNFKFILHTIEKKKLYFWWTFSVKTNLFSKKKNIGEADRFLCKINGFFLFYFSV